MPDLIYLVQQIILCIIDRIQQKYLAEYSYYALIILGGIGFLTWEDFYTNKFNLNVIVCRVRLF